MTRPEIAVGVFLALWFGAMFAVAYVLKSWRPVHCDQHDDEADIETRARRAGL